ncbi:MAG: thiolase family protein [Sneathiella sp.]
MRDAFIVAARRTAVCPREGAFSKLEVADLAAPVMKTLLNDTGIAAEDLDQVILGNALYGGGNPARVAALQAGIEEDKPAMTLDTQCCSGLDSVGLAVQMIKAGEAEVVLAGGVESYSRSPIRQRRPKAKGEEPASYTRPPFTPWRDRDPDMLISAADFALTKDISRADQERFAIASQQKAVAVQQKGTAEIIPLAGITRDSFTRPLTEKLCARLPLVAGDAPHALTAATIAVEADAAAAVLVVSDKKIKELREELAAVRILGYLSTGCDPETPLRGLYAATDNLLKKYRLTMQDVAVVEAMEAFAVQMIDYSERLQLDPNCLNRGGGALSRGHPVGASGAINIVRLWHELQQEEIGVLGLASIAAAGGLGSALILQRV